MLFSVVAIFVTSLSSCVPAPQQAKCQPLQEPLKTGTFKGETVEIVTYKPFKQRVTTYTKVENLESNTCTPTSVCRKGATRHSPKSSAQTTEGSKKEVAKATSTVISTPSNTKESSEKTTSTSTPTSTKENMTTEVVVVKSEQKECEGCKKETTHSGCDPYNPPYRVADIGDFCKQ